jgi:hypothetical protein
MHKCARIGWPPFRRAAPLLVPTAMASALLEGGGKASAAASAKQGVIRRISLVSPGEGAAEGRRHASRQGSRCRAAGAGRMPRRGMTYEAKHPEWSETMRLSRHTSSTNRSSARRWSAAQNCCPCSGRRIAWLKTKYTRRSDGLGKTPESQQQNRIEPKAQPDGKKSRPACQRGSRTGREEKPAKKLDKVALRMHKTGSQSISSSLNTSGNRSAHCHLPENPATTPDPFLHHARTDLDKQAKKLTMISAFRLAHLAPLSTDSKEHTNDTTSPPDICQPWPLPPAGLLLLLHDVPFVFVG